MVSILWPMELGSWIAIAALILTVGHTTMVVINFRRTEWKAALDQCLKDLERCEDTTMRLRDDNAWLQSLRSGGARRGRPDPA